MIDIEDFIAKARDPNTASIILRREKAEALADEIERLLAVLRDLEYWLNTDPEILDAMSEDDRRDHLNQLAKVRALLSVREQTPETGEKEG